MKTFPKGFPSDGRADLKGKEYITKPGLVWLATNRGPWSSTIDHVERVFGENGLPIYMEVTVTVTDWVSSPPTSHTAIGDAALDNVGKMIANALPRMAHTRALGRALAASLGIGRTAAEEIPPDDVGEAPGPRGRTRSAPRSSPRPAPRAAQSNTASEWSKGDRVETETGNVGTIFWIGGDKGDSVGVRWGEGEDDKQWTYLRFLKAPTNNDENNDSKEPANYNGGSVDPDEIPF